MNQVFKVPTDAAPKNIKRNSNDKKQSNLRANRVKDIEFIRNVLRQQGIHNYDASIVNELLAFGYGFAQKTLYEAKAFSTHAKKRNVDAADIKIANEHQIKMERNTCSHVTLAEVAKKVNSRSLPTVRPQHGWRLPSYRQWLSGTNYKMNFLKKPQKVPPSSLQEPRIIKRSMYKPNMSYNPFNYFPLRFDGKMLVSNIDLT